MSLVYQRISLFRDFDQRSLKDQGVFESLIVGNPI